MITAWPILQQYDGAQYKVGLFSIRMKWMDEKRINTYTMEKF